MTRQQKRRAAFAALAALFLAHNDIWLWADPRFVLGLPIGLLYHVVYCVAAAGAMALLVHHAWPAHLEVEEPPRERV